MNRFESLPDDIQEKIYFEVHKLKCKDTFKKINSVDFWRRDDRGFAILSMTNLLYFLGASKNELKDYFFCLDWLGGKRLNITMEDMIKNKYYDVYYDYWDLVEESEYHNGDYIY
jgi:hypothetical protein